MGFRQRGSRDSTAIAIAMNFESELCGRYTDAYIQPSVITVTGNSITETVELVSLFTTDFTYPTVTIDIVASSITVVVNATEAIYSYECVATPTRQRSL